MASLNSNFLLFFFNTFYRFYFDFSPTYVGCGLICPHIISCSVLLGAIISWGFLWPYISQYAGDWYPIDLGSSDFKGLYGYKVRWITLFRCLWNNSIIVYVFLNFFLALCVLACLWARHLLCFWSLSFLHLWIGEAVSPCFSALKRLFLQLLFAGLHSYFPYPWGWSLQSDKDNLCNFQGIVWQKNQRWQTSNCK